MITPEFVQRCIKRAEALETKLSPEVFALRGFSSKKNRILLNELCSLPYVNYLEVGTWAGSTLASAAYMNKGRFIGIDNFSQFQSDEAGFNVFESLDNAIALGGADIRFYEDDFRNVERQYIDDIDVYFYDGNHSEQETSEGLKWIKPILAKTALVIVDDLELTPSVAEGIRMGIEGWNVADIWELKKADGYHEGLWMAVINA